MTGARVRWRRSDEEFEVLGHGRLWFSAQTTVSSSAEVIEPASLSELRRALDRCKRDMYEGDYLFEIFDAPPEQLARHEDMFFSRPVTLEFADQQTLLNLVAAFASDEPAPDRRDIATLLSPLLLRMRATFVSLTADTQLTATVCTVSVSINPRGLTVGEALRMGEDLMLLWEAATGGSLTPAAAGDRVRAQRAELLIGLCENQ